jgi:hypothetical protein
MHSTLSLLLVFLNQFFMPRHNAQLRLGLMRSNARDANTIHRLNA